MNNTPARLAAQKQLEVIIDSAASLSKNKEAGFSKDEEIKLLSLEIDAVQIRLGLSKKKWLFSGSRLMVK